MRSVEMDRLRWVVQALSRNGKEAVTNAMIYEAFGLKTEDEKVRLRSRIGDLVKRKEMIRIAPGKYNYNPDAQPGRQGESYVRIWRAIRVQKSGWTFKEIAQVTRVSYSQVRKYCKYLLEEGYIERFGKSGRERRYRTTAKAREQRETVYPPVAIKDPFAREKAAAVRLVRVFLEMDPCTPAARRRILEECGVIIERFKKEGK